MKRTALTTLALLTLLITPTLAAEHPQKLQEQIQSLQAQHDALVEELKAIHALAAREDADQTASRVEKLIARRQETFRNELEQLKGGRQGMLSGAKKAPEAKLTSFGGQTFDLGHHKDKTVVLEWFNFECPFSRYHYETKQTMADLARKYEDKGVVWLAVNSTNHTTSEANVAYAKKHKVPYPIIDDRSGRVGRAFEAKTTPHMFVIHKGAIVYDGPIDNAPLGRIQGGGEPVNYVDQVLSRLTTGREVEPTSQRPYGCSVKYKK